MRKISREFLTVEEIMTFTDTELAKAKMLLEAEINKINRTKPVTILVINNDVGSRRTPEQFREAELKPHLHNLALIDEAIKNRKSIIDFMNTPDYNLDEDSQVPSQE